MAAFYYKSQTHMKHHSSTLLSCHALVVYEL